MAAVEAGLAKIEAFIGAANVCMVSRAAGNSGAASVYERALHENLKPKCISQRTV
ncbi:hypothetical protein GGQ64_002928 [Rhizobium azooxidifex]|uniref:Uncharacterized protein n=1 Tax=Mycoplana azooxidifex TaxID=1636188 RepID=A0A7W6D7Z2_9HYPH|nr:hypothetical protein [Mycoplana azooxidifex]